MRTRRAFEVEHAGCDTCSARVRTALAPLAAVRSIEVDPDRDVASVELETDAELSEEAVNEALLRASMGGHSYRVKTGSWTG